jgi:hypothetical protein
LVVDGTGTTLAAVLDIAQEWRCDLAASASQYDSKGIGNRLSLNFSSLNFSDNWLRVLPGGVTS